MEGVMMLIFLSITMLIGSFIAGLVPLTLNLSESKMKHLTIIGAGLLIGTALAVIIPEGINTLYSNQKCSEDSHKHNKRSIDRNFEIFKNQLSYNVDLDKAIRFKRQSEMEIFLNQLSPNANIKKRFLRDTEKADAKDHQLLANEQLKIKESLKKADEAHESEHEHEHSGSSHSAVGITLVLGFVFMLIIDQIGGKMSHKPHQVLDTQAIRNKITFTTTLGLVVHAAADGIALGAAAATSKTDIEMIVFVAIMLHKAPAALGLVSFLMHEGLDRATVRKHLAIFAMAAPVLAILTFLILNSSGDSNVVSSNSTGLCMLFSAGTFLYVSTVHVLPEVQSHNDDRQFRTGEMLSFIIGALMPVFLTVGHSH
ncbi:unnamed protein product [Brachionus calyciflorus]|uniref:Zinc transporter ZIP9 n=1 Tax=Brachionus calyciflorus TaxID=104777 RepID=A0A813VML3_9BILA|nr:unnamed protein product [Brachionus calyciflorus]